MTRSTSLARNVALSAAAALVVLVGGLLVLFLFAFLTTVVPYGSAYVWANIGVIVSLVVVALTLVAAIEVAARRWGKRVARTTSITVIVGLLVIGISLTQHPAPLVQPFTEFFLPKGPHDVLIIIDPNDPSARALVDQAKSNPGALTPIQISSWGADVAFGIAVLRPPGTGAPWSLVQPPTPDFSKVIAALGSVEPNAGGRATRSLGPALRQLAAPHGTGTWTKDIAHTILFATGKLPTESELLTRGGSTKKEWEDTLDALARSAAPRFERSAFSVIWDPTKPPTGQTRDAWRSWTRRALGNAAEPTMGFFDAAAFASLKRYFTQDIQLSRKYRPDLRLDSEERFRPRDMNALLAEQQPTLCEPKQLRRDDCPPRRVEEFLKRLHGRKYNPEDKSYVLERLFLANKKSYVKLGGDERTGRDLPADDPGAVGRIYYKVTRRAGRAYVEYWWFFRFNESPAYSRYMCLAGLSIASASCFDHQGDWEGITVSVVDKEGEGTRGARVTYTGHNWPGYSYPWEELSKRRSIADRTHPLVYVAKGSHASYPTRCESDCTQLDFRAHIGPFKVKVPDGRRDGKVPWPRAKARLEPLPLDFTGRPSHWLAYQGQWGSSACTYVLKSCTRVTGPHSPAYQDRYGHPFKLTWGKLKYLGPVAPHR
jgi:hypothetical protein